MSTSALASARRRRATNESQVVTSATVNTATTASAIANPNTNVNKIVQQGQKNITREQTQTLTPLQLLQIHDLKLKELDTLFTEFTDEELLSKFIEDKMENFVNSNSKATNSSIQTPLYDEKIQILEKSIEQKIELQNSKIDEFKTFVRELLNNFKEENNNIMK